MTIRECLGGMEMDGFWHLQVPWCQEVLGRSKHHQTKDIFGRHRNKRNSCFPKSPFPILVGEDLYSIPIMKTDSIWIQRTEETLQVTEEDNNCHANRLIWSNTTPHIRSLKLLSTTSPGCFFFPIFLPWSSIPICPHVLCIVVWHGCLLVDSGKGGTKGRCPADPRDDPGGCGGAQGTTFLTIQLVRSTKFWPRPICWCRWLSDCISMVGIGFWFYLGFLLTHWQRRIVREVMGTVQFQLTFIVSSSALSSEDAYSAKHRPLTLGLGCLLFHHCWSAFPPLLSWMPFPGALLVTGHVSFMKTAVAYRWHLKMWPSKCHLPYLRSLGDSHLPSSSSKISWCISHLNLLEIHFQIYINLT